MTRFTLIGFIRSVLPWWTIIKMGVEVDHTWSGVDVSHIIGGVNAINLGEKFEFKKEVLSTLHSFFCKNVAKSLDVIFEPLYDHQATVGLSLPTLVKFFSRLIAGCTKTQQC